MTNGNPMSANQVPIFTQHVAPYLKTRSVAELTRTQTITLPKSHVAHWPNSYGHLIFLSSPAELWWHELTLSSPVASQQSSPWSHIAMSSQASAMTNYRQRNTKRQLATASRPWTPHAVITSLEDTQPYKADEKQHPTLTPKGDINPGNSRKRQFPRGLRRLRERLQTLEDRLKLDVNALRQQIADLHLQRSLTETKTQLQFTARVEGAVGTVVEYYGAFHHGWLEG